MKFNMLEDREKNRRVNQEWNETEKELLVEDELRLEKANKALAAEGKNPSGRISERQVIALKKAAKKQASEVLKEMTIVMNAAVLKLADGYCWGRATLFFNAKGELQQMEGVSGEGIDFVSRQAVYLNAFRNPDHSKAEIELIQNEQIKQFYFRLKNNAKHEALPQTVKQTVAYLIEEMNRRISNEFAKSQDKLNIFRTLAKESGAGAQQV